MAASLHKTKRRIQSINSTKKITKAMELVATVQLRKFKNVMEKNKYYSGELGSLINHLFSCIDDDFNSQYSSFNEGKDLYVVINSNLGLCASYNNEIFNYVVKNISKDNSSLLLVGIKGENFYKKEGYETIDTYLHVNEKFSYDEIIKLGNYLHELFISKKYKSINLIFTHYVNSIRFVPNQITLFPITKKSKNNVCYSNTMFDPNVNTIIATLIPIYVNATLYQKFLESIVSEQASRRTAMENATDNANEIIDNLVLEYNKARQAQITQEISEVISGVIR